MSAPNSGRKIAHRSLSVIPLAGWHSVAAILWTKGEGREKYREALCDDTACWGQFYSSGFGLIEYHLKGLIVLMCGLVAIILLAAYAYWMFTGGNLFRSEKSAEASKLCKNSNCTCPRHTGEEFIYGDWRPRR